MGPRGEPPPLPDLEPNMVEGGHVSAWQRACNWMQALEGDIDTVHLGFLHVGSVPAGGHGPRNVLVLRGEGSRAAVLGRDIDGASCTAPIVRRTTNWTTGASDSFCSRSTPCRRKGSLVVGGHSGLGADGRRPHAVVHVRVRSPAPNRPPRAERSATTSSDWHWALSTVADEANDYLIDRGNSGATRVLRFARFLVQDQAITESMGVYLRPQPGAPGDQRSMIIRTRRRLLAAAQNLRDEHTTPPGSTRRRSIGCARVGFFFTWRGLGGGDIRAAQGVSAAPEVDLTISGPITGL